MSSSRHEDLISRLPDDILIPIISHLNTPEAAATSILTTRWRYLYTYTTRLHFPLVTLPDMDQNVITSFPRYIEAINRVLKSHKGVPTKELRVYTYCLKGATIGKWFAFAFAKKVEILHIHMNTGRMDYDGHCTLRSKLNLKEETLTCLKELSLLGIDLSDGDFQLLLRKFPLLESLSIKGTISLRHVAMVGHLSSKLKHLEISHDRYYSPVEIDIDNLVNLVSLWCLKLKFFLKIKNVPKLTELITCDDYNDWGTCARILVGMPASIQHNLQTLKIFTMQYGTKDYEQLMPLQLNSVQNLELQHRVDHFDKIDFSLPFHIIRACNLLEKLHIKFCYKRIPSLIEVIEACPKYTSKLPTNSMKVCPNLKKMKISGFIGSPSELEVIFSILRKVNTLEELVVETCDKNQKIRIWMKKRAQRYLGLKRIKGSSHLGLFGFIFRL